MLLSMLTNPHLRSHLLAFWLAVVGVVLGVMLMVSPAMGESSPALDVMPSAGVFVWGGWFAAGGASVIFGLVSLRRRWESAGSVMLGASYMAALIGGLFAQSTTPLGILFLLAITTGFLHRAYFLVKSPLARDEY
jgi:hypothetical protein